MKNQNSKGTKGQRDKWTKGLCASMPLCLCAFVALFIFIFSVIPAWAKAAEIGRSTAGKTEFRIAVNLGQPRPGECSLWYRQPADAWVKALPIGNGRLGAMVFGGTASERIQFNEDTLWVGKPHDYSHAGAAEYLSQIRQLLFEDRQKEAEQLAMKEFMSVPLHQMPYQPFGDIRLSFPGHDRVENYKRWLDIDEAIASVQYDVNGVTYLREVFASCPHNVIVIRITASKPGMVGFTAKLDTPHKNTSTAAVGIDQLALRGRLGEYNYRQLNQMIDCAIEFEARLQVRTEGGKVNVTPDLIGGSGITVEGSNAATLLLAGATNYLDFRNLTQDPQAKCENTLNAVADTDYKDLRASHVNDYQRLFGRVLLDLGAGRSDLPTDERIKNFTAGDDPQLAALYFQFGRYLLIACSRPGSQPANLQGIWNDQTSPAWESKYTVNINTEMNYWPAEVCNLAECTQPLFDALDEIAISGQRTAKEQYNCRGWVLHHNFDLWRGTAPINNSNHGIWPTGGAWLCQNLWWHYEFSGDKKFLSERAYPLMKGAALFFVDYLITDPRNNNGWLISGPSNSPEQGGLVMGPTMDHQIIRDLFRSTIEAGRILGVDEQLRQKLQQICPKIAPNQIGKGGQLQEWLEDVDDPKNTHRHISHLWALMPGSEITPHGTPKLIEAVKTSLKWRGDAGTSWSKAWKINCWARLLDGDHAYSLLVGLINQSSYDNLFSAHPPFQIDGNFGGANAIAEMLLQSQGGEIALLPALPSAWPKGSVSGLRARGGFTVDIVWDKGRLTGATLRRLSNDDTVEACRLCTTIPVVVQSEGKTLKNRDIRDNVIEFDTTAGGIYNVTPRIENAE